MRRVSVAQNVNLLVFGWWPISSQQDLSVLGTFFLVYTKMFKGSANPNSALTALIRPYVIYWALYKHRIPW